MAKRVQHYRIAGSTMATTTGLEGEIIVNLTNFSAHIHDGLTIGGFELGLANASNIQIATTSQNGKMLDSQVLELETATADIAINVADIATNINQIATNLADIATLQTDKANQITPMAANNVATLSVDGDLQDSGLLVTDVGLEAGTVATFHQDGAPIGWTKNATHNNKAFRVVTGSVSTGGVTGFTSVFGSGKASAAVTLTAAQSGLPSHNHTLPDNVSVQVGGGAMVKGTVGSSTSTGVVAAASAVSGHAHNLTLDLLYVDLILATKD